MTKSKSRLREIALIALPVLALVVGTFVLAYQFVEPAPPRKIALTTGNALGAYHSYGKKYQAALAKSGITIDLKPSAGTIENLARLTDPNSGVQAGLVQGGLANAEKHPGLTSLGRMYLEPLWLFHRADITITRLTDLAGKRVAVGPDGSGTRPLVTAILKASAITAENTTFLGPGSSDAADMLVAGQADAAFFALAAESEITQKLLRNPALKAYSFSQADALTRLYPYLTKIVLPAGVVDMAANIPAQDVTLVAPAATLVVRGDLHPAVVGLLVDAAKSIHGGAGLFQRPGEYPQAVDTEIPMDEDAARYYKNGLPFLQRYLPFWLAVFLERMTVMIIPIATILLPLFKVVPMVYQWRIKQRMLYWYDQLKKLERQIRNDRSPGRIEGYKAEIHRIEDAVSVIPMPLAFSDQLYTLRSAVDLVRQRISALQTAA
jgi:uncharacterized protein